MNTVRLNNGILMPVLGFGTWRISSESIEKYVTQAIHAGYRLFDTAEYYGNEAEVGRTVNGSGLPREDIFITTKTHHGGYRAAKRAIDESLKGAGQEYFDLCLVHYPMPDFMGTYRALEEAYKEGKLRSIGVSNFGISHLQQILGNFETVPAVNQIETNAYIQNKPLAEFMKKHGIELEAYAPLGEGPNAMFRDPYLMSLASKYGKTTAQIMLKFLVQSHFIAIPGSQNPVHIRENIDVFDFELTEAEMNRIRELDHGMSSWIGYQG